MSAHPSKSGNGTAADSAVPFGFGARVVGPTEPVLVIAEVGINHEGDAEVCARMIEEAVKAGADAIKFQTIDPDRNYQPETESHRIFSAAVLDRETTARMFRLVRELGAEPFTTAGDFATLEWVDRLDPAAHKISSGLLTCTPIIAAAAKTGRPLVMSTGMAEVADIDLAVAAARDAGNREIALLHCISLYPTPFEKLALASIGWLERRYGVPAGFSDHSEGIQAAALAAAAGAVMIEKHFSLDSTRAGFDHGISLEPREFKQMVQGVREATLARGCPYSEGAPGLADVRNKMSRYLAVIAPVSAGDRLDERNVGFVRLIDQSGVLPASSFDQVRGKRAAKDMAPFTAITKASIAQ